MSNTKSFTFGAAFKSALLKGKDIAGKTKELTIITAQIAKIKAEQGVSIAKASKAEFVKGYNSVK
jgi:hypothetical protein